MRKEQNHVRKYFLNLELKSRERCCVAYMGWVWVRVFSFYILFWGGCLSGLLLESEHTCVLYIGCCINAYCFVVQNGLK